MYGKEKKEERTRLTNKHERGRKIDLACPPSLSLCLKGYIKMSKIMIKNKKKNNKNVHFFILTYLALGKYIVDSIKTEPDKRMYQQVFNSPRLKKKWLK